MKSSIASMLFGSLISIIVILGAGAGLATDPTFIDVLNLCLGIGLYGATIYFFGDATAHHARMEVMKFTTEHLKELREELDKIFESKEQPPKAGKKK